MNLDSRIAELGFALIDEYTLRVPFREMDQLHEEGYRLGDITFADQGTLKIVTVHLINGSELGSPANEVYQIDTSTHTVHRERYLHGIREPQQWQYHLVD